MLNVGGFRNLLCVHYLRMQSSQRSRLPFCLFPFPSVRFHFFLEFSVSANSRGSIVLWRIYIEFELRYGKPQRAKEMILRAVRDCPWSKGA
jgi:hypothetical protein